jgi:hypothetical protein
MSTHLMPVLPFDEARQFVRGLKLAGVPAFRLWARGGNSDLPRRPIGIPANPSMEYRDRGWIDWGDFLGTGSVAPWKRRYRPFPQAREFARGLGLRGHLEWKDWWRSGRPGVPPSALDLPCNADQIYANRGWKGWGDFLGTGNVWPKHRVWREFDASRRFARGLGLRTVKEWRRYATGGLPDLPPLPSDIPYGPDRTYAGKGWRGWVDFLRGPPAE